MWSSAPFALFPVVEIPIETLNKILTLSHKGAQSSHHPFYLPTTSSPSDTPLKTPGKAVPGTSPPRKTYTSPFLDKTVAELATWLSSLPESSALDKHFFAILDKTALAEEPEVVICRIGDAELKGEEVECLRLGAEDAAAQLYAAQPGGWEEVRDVLGVVDVVYE